MRAKVKIFGNENNCITNIYYKFVMQLKKGIRRLEKVGSVKWYIITFNYILKKADFKMV